MLVAAAIVDGVRAEGALPLLATSLLLGVLNAFIRPFLLIIALPLVFLTLGLFALVINALLLYFVASLVKGFYVVDFWAALKGAILISIVSVFANMMFGAKPLPAGPGAQRHGGRRPPPDSGSGPVIDV